MLARYCAEGVGLPAVQSRGQSLTLQYAQAFPSTGFSAHFATVCRSALSFLGMTNRVTMLDPRNLRWTSPSGTLQSPGFAVRSTTQLAEVASPRNCDWTLETSPGNLLYLDFQFFRIKVSRHSRGRHL